IRARAGGVRFSGSFGRAALEFADLDRAEARQVQLHGLVHRGAAVAGVEVDALALDRAAGVGGVPVAVVLGAVGHGHAHRLLDEEDAATGDDLAVHGGGAHRHDLAS